MNDRVEGTAREFGGRVQETVGNVTGDSKTQAQGLYNQAAGQAQQAAGQFSDVDQVAADRRLACCVGYWLCSRTTYCLIDQRSKKGGRVPPFFCPAGHTCL